MPPRSSNRTARMSTGGQAPKAKSAEHFVNSERPRSPSIPSPGSGDYDDLPPVSTTFDQVGIRSGGKRLVFGTISEEEDDKTTTNLDAVSPKRVRVLSKKARYMREGSYAEAAAPASKVASAKDPFVSSPKRQPPLPKKSTRVKAESVDSKSLHPEVSPGLLKPLPVKKTGKRGAPSSIISISSASDIEWPLSPLETANKTAAGDSLDLNQSDVDFIDDRDEEKLSTYDSEEPVDAGDDEEPVLPSKRKIMSNERRHPNPPNTPASERRVRQKRDDAAKQMENPSTPSFSATKGKGKEQRTVLSDLEEEEKEPGEPSSLSEVTLKAFPSNLTASTTVVEDNRMLDRQAVYDIFANQPSVISNLKAAFHFNRYKVFINPAKVDPTYLTSYMDRIVVANTSSYPLTAVLLMAGAISSCNLREPADTGTLYRPTKSKRIIIFPFREEFQRSLAVIGKVLGKKMFFSGIIGGMVPFTSRPDAAARPSQASTPKKKSWFETSSSAPPSPEKKTGSKNSFPASLAFDDEVPIYDARQKDLFSFIPSDFERLKTLPLWNPSNDLPEYSLVTIGYSAGSYKYTPPYAKTPEDALSLSVLFVILHGFAP